MVRPHPLAHLGHTLMFCHPKSFYITSPWQTASSLPISKTHLRETRPLVAPSPHLLSPLSQLPVAKTFQGPLDASLAPVLCALPAFFLHPSPSPEEPGSLGILRLCLSSLPGLVPS